MKKEVGTEPFSSEKSEEISENCSLIFGEFRIISDGVGSVTAVYKVLSLEQKSKVIFVPGSFCFFIAFAYFLLFL